MTPQEKDRLEELRNQVELTEAEDGELARLIALEKELGDVPAVEIEEEPSGDEIDTQG